MTSKKNKIKINQIDYLCRGCAKNLTAEWPDGHIATFHDAKCDVCGKIKGLSHRTDWDWSNKQLRIGREI
jgi:hypothetical protein